VVEADGVLSWIGFDGRLNLHSQQCI
jgi:hypothetical protein